jgi:hypothetical protein
MHQLFATYLMPPLLTWEGLLLLIRRKLSRLLRYGIIKEIAVAYENLAIYFEVDNKEHNIPICHCWCSIATPCDFDAMVVHAKLQSLGLLLLEKSHEISDDYLEGMKNLIFRSEDYDGSSKYIRWKVFHPNGTVHLIKVNFGLEEHNIN